jgi:methylated-DNA-[protein]-cysteine S-methyltransferase
MASYGRRQDRECNAASGRHLDLTQRPRRVLYLHPNQLERSAVTAAHTTIDSPLGPLTLVSREGLLAGLYFPGHWYPPTAAMLGTRSGRGFAQAEAQLTEYLAGERTGFELARAPAAGDEFQRRVWGLIDAIPFGETTTYGEMATELGDSALARRVGAAVGRNPLSVIVPCHRVVGRDGKLTGYAGGLERKRFLLELEGAIGVPEAEPTLF